jgi:undecaprenyl diphosphate synthase
LSATGEVQTQTGSGDGFESPRHVAIIMDGNGRWAAARGLPRVEGHRRGVEALRKTVRAANDLGISAASSATIWSICTRTISASASSANATISIPIFAVCCRRRKI